MTVLFIYLGILLVFITILIAWIGNLLLTIKKQKNSIDELIKANYNLTIKKNGKTK